MASSPPVIARPERQGAANGELSPAKPPHPAVEASAAAQSVIEGEQHGLQEGGNPSPTAAVAGAAPGHLATPSVTREPHSQAEATTPRHHAVVVAAAPGASSAGSTPRGAVVSSPGRGRQAASGMLYEGSPLHGASRSSRAPGLQTFGSQYMPYAAGFAYMASEAPVYRSSRLHATNPTAAISEDTSYLYTLDSGLETAATLAANPDRLNAEHVRNTGTGTKGGMMGKLFGPIR